MSNFDRQNLLPFLHAVSGRVLFSLAAPLVGVALLAVKFRTVLCHAFMGNCAPDDVHRQFPMLSNTQHSEWKEYGRKRKKWLLFI